MEATPGPTTPAAPVAAPEKPNGPVAAVLLAAGIGALVLGILTTLAEASESFGASIEYDLEVGPLSGKTLWAAGAFLVSWGALTAFLRHRDLAWKTVITATVVLIALGILGTFPIFFQEFAPAE